MLIPNNENVYSLDQMNAHYYIDLMIEPETKFIKVEGTFKVPVLGEIPEIYVFYLHRQLNIHKFSINSRQLFHIDNAPSDIRYMPEAKKIILNTIDADKNTDYLEFHYAYSGNITKRPEFLANTLTEEWVELGLYFPWFPILFDKTEFTYKVNISIDPSYTVFSIGEHFQDDNINTFKNVYPTSDIVIVASQDLKIRIEQIQSHKLYLVYYSLGHETIDILINDIDHIYEYFNNIFGKNEGSIALVESKREKGGGYSRPGGLFLPGFENADYIQYRIGYQRYLAHEVSHNWWQLADSTTWQDWLNESFAEYSALMFLRETSGIEEFNKRIKGFMENISDTLPIWEIDRNDENAHTVLYEKGPVLLYRLEAKIGNDAFISLCQGILEEKIRTTEDFLKYLEYHIDKETRVWFEKLLKEA